MLRSALRFIAGAALGVAIWHYAGPVYHTVVASLAQPLVNLDPRLRHVEVRASGAIADARGDENEPELPRILIPISELTYNIVLLVGLFATNRRIVRDRELFRLLAAITVLFVTHVLATAITIEATFATRIPNWSDKHYSFGEQDFWTAAEYAYRLAGMFAIAFGCWWMTVSVPSTDRTAPAPPAA